MDEQTSADLPSRDMLRAALRAGRRDAGTPIRVALAASDFIEREGIAAVLDRIDGIELVAACPDLDALRAAVARTSPDVVVTDVRLPPGSSDEGIRLAAELRATHPRTGVVVLGDDAAAPHATALFAGGSYRRAYLLKERLTDPGKLARAVREVAGGGALVDPRLVDRLMSARHSRGRSPLASLTAREREILALVAEGHSNGPMAEQLGISKRGVERHINAIFAKLELGHAEGVSRRVKAVLLFLADDDARAEHRPH